VYITANDLTDAYGADEVASLADRDGDGVADEPVLADVCVAASAEADSYLAQRYAVPVPLDAHLRGVVLAIARWKLEPAHAVQAGNGPSKAAIDYRNAIAWLDRVARGVVVLFAATPASPTSSPSIRASAPPPVFDAVTLRDY
jgi:phage gp36-like protein